MGVDAIEAKKQQMSDFFDTHPDAVEVEILDGQGGSVVDSIYGLMDYPQRADDARQMGAVEYNKRLPCIIFYTGHASKFTARTTYVRIDGTEWKVRDVEPDQSPGTYQAILWLV